MCQGPRQALLETAGQVEAAASSFREPDVVSHPLERSSGSPWLRMLLAACTGFCDSPRPHSPVPSVLSPSPSGQFLPTSCLALAAPPLGEPVPQSSAELVLDTLQTQKIFPDPLLLTAPSLPTVLSRVALCFIFIIILISM